MKLENSKNSLLQLAILNKSIIIKLQDPFRKNRQDKMEISEHKIVSRAKAKILPTSIRNET